VVELAEIAPPPAGTAHRMFAVKGDESGREYVDAPVRVANATARDALSPYDGMLVWVDGAPPVLWRWDSGRAQWERATVDVYSPRMFGAALDGATDDTDAINAAIAAANAAGGGTVIIDGDAHVSATNAVVSAAEPAAIVMKSNVRLVFSNGAQVTLEPNDKIGYQMIVCDDLSNFAIVNAHLTGDKAGHTGGTGEWGMCLSLLGCTGFTIDGGTFQKGWGDGIYVGAGTQGYCLRGRIVNVNCDDNRRQAMSIISVDDVEIAGGRFTNTSGTTPQCGIDIEPNNSTERLRGLRIIDPYFEGNAADGLLMFLGSLRATTMPVDIVVRGLHSFEDLRGLELNTTGASGNHVTGRIVIERPYIESSRRSGIRITRWDKTGPEVTIDTPVIINPATDGPAALGTAETTGITFAHDSAISAGMGNITVIRPKISDDVPNIEYGFFSQDGVGGSHGRVSIVDPLEITGATIAPYWNEFLQVRDTNRVSVWTPNSNQTLNHTPHYPIVDNVNFTALRTITLGATLAVGTRLVFEMTGAQTMRITPQAGDTILVLGTGAGASVDLTQQGTRVVLRKISSTLWMPVEITGLAPYDLVGFFGATPVVQPAGANQAALTNNTGGAYDGTLGAVSGSGADNTINANFTDLHTLLDEIRTALVNVGVMKGGA
jgi:hypothetical protein